MIITAIFVLVVGLILYVLTKLCEIQETLDVIKRTQKTNIKNNYKNYI